MDQTKITITNVAEFAGVSKSLVSSYLNGRFDNMSEATRKRIEETIQSLGYEPKEQYRNFKKRERGIIGLILPDITDPFYSLCSKAIADGALNHDYMVLFANSDNNVGVENTYLDKFSECTDGIIIATVGRNDQQIMQLKDKVPVVLLDRRMKEGMFDGVSSNNYESTMDMMKYLISLGYEAFGFFVEELVEGMSRVIRYQSYMDFIKEHNLYDASFIYNVNLYDEMTMISNLIEFREQTKGKKAVIICANGKTLLHVITGVDALKINVPNDIGICGYDDFEAAALIHSGITTINQPTYDIGYACVKQLVKRINQNGDYTPKEINLRSKLVIRGSV
ncbi:LacI family DNA-binding transcriptional regulator [Lachnoclostridium phytofermentans]|uniref:Transcriptional regulator, LacI family n=1 Tax=Lachnoclostridium phytofermentans (strain ATCC 700394 / DSM 18823 / ISDg) TaxID=357809 RepID=A9KI37_LACP7|nr:substrate-binding domain-containing protein [Lachnoclostridium phytofermentans]ABX40871.1 transcriptional regulator, LacI family [Lachnoclostridium phytofermentans ISDg]